jgi:membrane protease YdiL (CAAX protease family)
MLDVNKVNTDKWIFLILWFLCIVGSWSILPYIYYLGALPSAVSIVKIFVSSTIQAIIFFGIVCWLSYLLVPKTDLTPFIAEQPLKRIVYPGVISGVLLGLIIYSVDMIVFQSPSGGVRLPFWVGLLASIYGAVNEEVFLRLFFFSLVYFLFIKIFKFSYQNRFLFLWITTIIVAIVFGLGHLPLAFKLAKPSFGEISRILLLNGIPGIVFGWLYWSRGLWSAMASHFITDLMIHVLL